MATRKVKNVSKYFNPLYMDLDIEELNKQTPIYIKVCRNVGGRNTYRMYQRQIIARCVRFCNDETNDVCEFFGGLRNGTILDNLRKCYEWIFDVNCESRYEKIYVDVSQVDGEFVGRGQFEEFEYGK